jgi:hypothetical protein
MYTEQEIRNTTDPKILSDVLRRGVDDKISHYAALNPNCPPEVLAEVLRRGKDDVVSWKAAQHPNCPKYKIARILLEDEQKEASNNAILNNVILNNKQPTLNAFSHCCIKEE